MTISINFPNAPTLGQQYPSPPTPGLPVYQWDGEKWITTAMPVANQSGVIAIQVFTTSGTYVPSPGMTTCVIECVGGGAGGGGCAALAAAGTGGGGGGGSGGYSRTNATTATVGASQVVTIGAFGTGGAAGSNAGTAGTATSLGALCIANGGNPGLGAGAGAVNSGGVGAAIGTGTVAIPGNAGDSGIGGSVAGLYGKNALGGNSAFGSGGRSFLVGGSTAAGSGGAGYGSGGAGGANQTATSVGAAAGGNGAPGICVITEYGMQAITGTDGGVVHYDAAQNLTSEVPPSTTVSQRAQARMNIYAAPFDAMSYSGMQINGSMEVSQERGSTTFNAVSGTVSNIQDGWYFNYTGTATITLGPQAPAGGGLLPLGYQNLMTVAATTGAAMASGDIAAIITRIEGYRVARLAWGTTGAQPLTIAFWTYATIPGTMGISFTNSGGARTYVASITINSANTWEFKTLTIPGDTTGTWLKTNGQGLNIRFCVGSGSSSTGTTGVWGGVNAYGPSTQTNFVATTSNVVYLTGVVVLPGIEAPSSTRSPLIMRPYDQELLTCQRYFQSPPYASTGFTPNATTARVGIVYRNIMRGAPLFLTPSVGSITVNTSAANPTATSASSNQLQTNGASIDVTCSGASFTTGQGCVVYTQSGSIWFDARL